jgi:hypothetical protein
MRVAAEILKSNSIEQNILSKSREIKIVVTPDSLVSKKNVHGLSLSLFKI